MANFGTTLIAGHLLNAYNPNMLYTGLRYAWTDDDWRRTIGMVACLGFNAWEFWLVPRLFCREALTADFGRAFIRQVNAVIEHAHAVGVKVEMLCSLASICRAWSTTGG